MSINARGFTLIEVLVISPIIILFIGAFLALLVSLTGESLVVREKNAAAYDTQAALDDIEASINQAITFLPTTGTVPIPQGKDNSTSAGTAFTNEVAGEPNTLIIRSAATTARPSDAARELIYMGAGACDSKNPLYTYYTVYFTALDPDTAVTTDRALYKRTILPQNPACKTVWQRGSCDVSRMTSHASVCKARDEKLVAGVATFDVQYYIGSSPTAVADNQAASATDVSINLGLSKQVAGSAVQYSGTVRANSLNVQTSESPTGAVTPPSNPPIQWSRNGTGPNPYRTTFTWSSVGSASNYLFRYRINGGSWVEQSVAQSASPSFNVDATARKQTIDVQVDVVSSNGTYSYGTLSNPTISRIPQWNECNMIGGWQWYGAPYNTMGYTKTSSGAVGLKGLIRAGSVGSTACILPAGFAPQDHLIFQAPSPNAAGTDTDAARVDVYPNGHVNITATPGSNNWWVSLDGIIFMTASGSPAWTLGSYVSPWYFNSYGDTYSNLKYYRDSRGRAWVQGLATGGGDGQTMGWMTSVMTPQYGGMHIPASTANRGGAVNINGSPAITSRPSYGSYVSTQFLYYATGGLYDLPLYNGWYNYSNGWSLAKCFKGTDDIVILQGLVAGGNPAAGGMTGVHGCGTSTPGMSTGYNAILPAWRNWERPARVDLNTDNYLYPISTDSGWTSLDGTHYIAD
jgi:type II secretory pathway pseudopilin PulG